MGYLLVSLNRKAYQTKKNSWFLRISLSLAMIPAFGLVNMCLLSVPISLDRLHISRGSYYGDCMYKCWMPNVLAYNSMYDFHAKAVQFFLCTEFEGYDAPHPVHLYRKGSLPYGWIRAAELGYAPAQHLLGNYYEFLKSDPDKAFGLYRSAADAGYGPAQAELAVCYALGKGVRADQGEAAWWLEKSSEWFCMESITARALFQACGLGGQEVNLEEAMNNVRRGIELAYGDGITYPTTEAEKVTEQVAKWFQEGWFQKGYFGWYNIMRHSAFKYALGKGCKVHRATVETLKSPENARRALQAGEGEAYEALSKYVQHSLVK